ncbi:MAG: type IV secretory system conjugative DNA transfer family protein [Bdellovibrionales bacterium]
MFNQNKRQEYVTLGKVSGSLWRKEELSEGQLNHHVHVVGASGYGKTVLLSHIIKQRIQQGKGLLFIDLKADKETLFNFSKHVAEADRLEDLMIFSLTEKNMSLPYNLVLDGTATQLRDRIMMSLEWSEEFYKNQSASFLLKLLIGLCWLRDNQKYEFHIGTILDCVNSPERIEELVATVPENQLKIKSVLEDCYSFLNSADNFKSLQGLRTQLESIVLSDFGDLVATNNPGINLFEAATTGKIIFIFLDTRRYSETAKVIGRLILQDLKSVSARVDAEISKADRRHFSVIIDEFADLAQEDFISFLDRARSASMSIVVAHQEICDLERISPEFAGRLMGNTSTLYAFLQKRPESAEMICGMAGTRKAWKETVQSEKFFGVDIATGGKSLREVEEFNIHPNTVKSLRVGKCVCIKKYPQSRAYLVDVSPQ